MKVSGVVTVIEEVKQYGQRGFKKRLVVIEQEKGHYTNLVPLDLLAEHCDDLKFKVGDEIEADFILSGRKWQKDASSEPRYFVSVEVTGITVLDSKPVQKKLVEDVEDDDDDVPF